MVLFASLTKSPPVAMGVSFEYANAYVPSPKASDLHKRCPGVSFRAEHQDSNSQKEAAQN
jgi:hypothetical protein